MTIKNQHLFKIILYRNIGQTNSKARLFDLYNLMSPKLNRPKIYIREVCCEKG